MPRTSNLKRGQGRPADGGVGRSTIIDSTKRILRELPPSRITISLIAREAGVDPALVRYYFKDRSNLLMEVVDDLLKGLPETPGHGGDPVEFIRERVRETHKFSRSAKHMPRWMSRRMSIAASRASASITRSSEPSSISRRRP